MEMVNFAALSAEQARSLCMRPGQSSAVSLIFGAPKPNFLSCPSMLADRGTPVYQSEFKTN